jgi:uncharacterized membrane protein YeaQ/YmgE (transglycosylase-associated protein family)
MLTWIWVALIGLIVGAIAKFLMPGKQGGGILITMLLGIGGSLSATFIGQQLGIYGQGEPAGFIASVLGAVALLLVHRLFTKSKGGG